MMTARSFFGDHELLSRDPARAKAFYAELFGWKMTDLQIPGFGTRTEIEPETGLGGAIMGTQGPDQPSVWAIYINVPNLEETVARTSALGGKVLQAPIEVKGEGAFAVVADPTGAVFKLWESRKAG